MRGTPTKASWGVCAAISFLFDGSGNLGNGIWHHIERVLRKVSVDSCEAWPAVVGEDRNEDLAK